MCNVPDDSLRVACSKLLSYREQAGIGFQLEKADDFLHLIRVALDNLPTMPEPDWNSCYVPDDVRAEIEWLVKDAATDIDNPHRWDHAAIVQEWLWDIEVAKAEAAI